MTSRLAILYNPEMERIVRTREEHIKQVEFITSSIREHVDTASLRLKFNKYAVEGVNRAGDIHTSTGELGIAKVGVTITRDRVGQEMSYKGYVRVHGEENIENLDARYMLKINSTTDNKVASNKNKMYFVSREPKPGEDNLVVIEIGSDLLFLEEIASRNDTAVRINHLPVLSPRRMAAQKAA